MTPFDLPPGFAVVSVSAGVVGPVLPGRCECCPLYCCETADVPIPAAADETTFCDAACLTAGPGLPTPDQDIASPQTFDVNGSYNLIRSTSPTPPQQTIWGCPPLVVEPDLPPGCFYLFAETPAPAYTRTTWQGGAGASCPGVPGLPLSASATRRYDFAAGQGPFGAFENSGTYTVSSVGVPGVFLNADGTRTYRWKSVTAVYGQTAFVQGGFPLTTTNCVGPAGQRVGYGVYPNCVPFVGLLELTVGRSCDKVVTVPPAGLVSGAAPCVGCPGSQAGPGPLAAPPDKCQWLGDRLEFKDWCPTGYGCHHRCTNPAPAVLDGHLGGNPEMVPAIDCGPGVCPGYLDAGGPWAVTAQP